MSKGIILVDMPERCNECKFWFAKATVPIEYRCMAEQKNITEKHLNKNKPDWCPIKPMPERKALTGDLSNVTKMGEELVKVGWNECLEKIEDGG